jgi:predicted amidohydrolase
MKERLLRVAATAPATYGFVPAAAVRATERMIQGRETRAAEVRRQADRMLDHHLRLAERAARDGARLIVIPEDCLRLMGLVSHHHREARCAERVQAAWDRYVERVGALCRRHGVFVAGGTVTRRDGRFHNSAVLLDPQGTVIAVYDKTHLPRNGEHLCLAPGESLPVFDTPLGRIGFLICWDILFPEAYGALALQGAELVLQPTFGHAGEWSDVTARCRAMDWAVPLVISMWGGPSCIVDSHGAMVAHTGRRRNAVAVATLDLAARRPLVYLQDVRREKPRERRTGLYVP